MSTPGSTAAVVERKSGLLYWAQRVVEECEDASQDFAADPVHDLRVAIRRCRSMADGFLSVDPDPGWKQMKRMAKPLFASLGELRDVQVMMEWVSKLSAADDPARPILLLELQVRETQLKAAAQQELGNFDRKQWLSLNVRLTERAKQVPLGGSVFQLLALERWNDARELHKTALRNRSGNAYHQLRIGIKRLRYTVENFLPSLHDQWSKDLRDLQDALGEVHDFDVLWTMLRIHHEVAPEVRAHWHTIIQAERNRRLTLYRERMVGRKTLWQKWHSALPVGPALRRAGLDKFGLWASFLDPHFERTTRVTGTALRLYEGLIENKVFRSDHTQLDLLEAAALTHEIGLSKRERGHRKRSFRMISKMMPPPGWSAEEMQAIATIARHHDGALSLVDDSVSGGIAANSRRSLLRLAGILRLAVALENATPATGLSAIVSRKDGVLILGLGELDTHIGPEGERLARAKYLLEAACGMPIKMESSSAAAMSRSKISRPVRKVNLKHQELPSGQS